MEVAAQPEAPDQHISKRTWFTDMKVDLDPALQPELEHLFAYFMRTDNALQSSTELLTGRPWNPIVWLLRLRLVEALESDLEKELDLVGELAGVDTLYYWEYRQSILKKIGTTASRKELDFTAKIISNNAKIYAAWSHRQWILKELEGNKNWGNLAEELYYCHEILKKDVSNALAWNQRLFVVRCTKEGAALKQWATEQESRLKRRETFYAIEAIFYQPDNEYPWIYLRHLHMHDMSDLCYNHYDFYVEVLREQMYHVQDLANTDGLMSESDANILFMINRRGCLHALNLILEFLQCGYKPPAEDDLVRVINFLWPSTVDSSSGLFHKVRSIIGSLDAKTRWWGLLEKSTCEMPITDIEDLVNAESRTSP